MFSSKIHDLTSPRYSAKFLIRGLISNHRNPSPKRYIYNTATAQKAQGALQRKELERFYESGYHKVCCDAMSLRKGLNNDTVNRYANME